MVTATDVLQAKIDRLQEFIDMENARPRTEALNNVAKYVQYLTDLAEEEQVIRVALPKLYQYEFSSARKVFAERLESITRSREVVAKELEYAHESLDRANSRIEKLVQQQLELSNAIVALREVDNV